MSSNAIGKKETSQWNKTFLMELFNQPFGDLLYQAQEIHRTFWDPNIIQISTLCSIKTGSCPENCSYCPQSIHYKTGVSNEALMGLEEAIVRAKQAKQAGSNRFCMGAAWRSPTKSQLKLVCKIIKEVKSLGLETCATLGLLDLEKAYMLKEAGLDYYNHNIDSSPEFYNTIITTRHFNDRLETIKCVRKAGINVCCGGIIGMGETQEDRAGMIEVLANLDPPPESVPINKLIPIPGTPLENRLAADPFDFVRTIAISRIAMPRSYIRLSAGRESMSDELQFMCFFAGANSIFYGEKLLTANNPTPVADNQLFSKLGLRKLENL